MEETSGLSQPTSNWWRESRFRASRHHRKRLKRTSSQRAEVQETTCCQRQLELRQQASEQVRWPPEERGHLSTLSCHNRPSSCLLRDSNGSAPNHQHHHLHYHHLGRREGRNEQEKDRGLIDGTTCFTSSRPNSSIKPNGLSYSGFGRPTAPTLRCTERVTPGERRLRGPLNVANYIVIATPLLMLLLAAAAAISGAAAYQLTNNLIANNLPPKFITTSATNSGSSSQQPGGGQQLAASNTEIVVRVKEGPASIGKLVYTLRGEDPDDDPLTFNVLGSTASDLLRVENVPGNQANVYLRKELDRETTESYQVVITLTDGKLGRGNWITKSMLIIVEDVNDNYPVFAPHRTAITIREDVRVPLTIETLEATDQDEGRFGQVIYKLAEQQEVELTGSSGAGGASKSQPPISDIFSIETIEGKGVISLIAPLDYEQRPLYQLRILAVDRAIEQERLSASTSILISVEDCDDRPPIFTFVPSITRIPENLPVGSPVVRVSAVDGDRGINNRIEYKLLTVNGQESGFERNLFDMDSQSGQVSVARELDRESDGDQSSSDSGSLTSSQPGSYVLQVRATELGSLGSDNSVSTELTVILTDVNDETPTFSQSVYFGELLENSAAESLVNLLPSSPSGALVVNQQSSMLAAQDFSATALQVSQQVSARVLDRDQGTNGTFTLHLEGEHAPLFEIWPREATNEANFMIKVSSEASRLQQLDYEHVRQFTFNIIAREKFAPPGVGGQLRSNSAQMTVYLKDANDNYPQFESELYRVEIPENAIRGMHICAVKATDADSGAYGSQGVRYTEIRGEKANKFKLDPLTGVITLKTNEHGFDRETIGQHHLIVEARDNNGSGNRNTSQLLIVLTDVNDQKPKFLLDQYEAFIYENELDFQSPLQVQALDGDLANTPNSRLTYSIVAGDPQGNFTIDPATGRIRVRNSLQILRPPSGTGESDIVLVEGSQQVSSIAGSANQQPATGLDFERIAQKRDDTRQFNLTVRAQDSGLPESLADTTHVIVLVYDKNDHAPIFTRPVYTKSIREDAKEGSPVIQVLAADGDHSPANSRITYRISSGAQDKFVIDADSGLVSVASGANLDIDRATAGQKRVSYLLNVLAFDGSFGPNQKSASALVNITIIDVNNKAPEFVTLGAARPASGGTTLSQQQQQQLMVVHVNEDAPYGLIVTRVVAADLDSGAELRYSINWARSEARNEDMVLLEPALLKDLFSIDPTDGTIKVAKQLDRELFDQVKLRLQVEDVAAQTADQVAHAYLLVRITDVNDNRPTFKKPVYKAVVNENSISGTSIITLTADDRDLNKTLRYSLDGTADLLRLVRINPRSGELTVNDKIDRELHPLINVTVRADDTGFPAPLTGTCQLLITVRDENDNNPIFLNASSPANTELLSAGADSSGGSGGQQPRNHNMNDTGYRSRSLATPGAQDSPVVVAATSSTATSGLEPSLPMLSPGAVAQIREDAPIGFQMAYVRAEDADVGNHGRVTYLLDAQSSGGKFRIDRDTGIISVSGPLDREQTRQYSLIIEACDNYDLGYATGESRRAFTQVNVQVSDVNDNAPLISTNLQSPPAAPMGPVPERAAGQLSYEDVMSSQGPHEQPLANCLFISEFQPLNEPILTIIASDADDPATPNGQLDLAIVNNLPQSELFALVPVAAPQQLLQPQQHHHQQHQRMQMHVYQTTPPPGSSNNELAGFGEPLLLGESRPSAHLPEPPEDDEAASASAPTASEEPTPAIRPKRAAHLYTTARQGPASYARSRLLHQHPPTEAPLAENLVSTATLASVRHSQASGSPGREQDGGGEQQVHVVLRESLKERVGNYSILVRASDRGQPPLSSVRLINICVQDVNNHAPVFLRPPLNHTIRVLENATLGSFVVQVEATDADHGINRELAYSLKATGNNQDWQAFKIDKHTGILSTAKQFNRQLKKYYTLRVQAQDFGRPTSLSSDIDLNIMIVNSGQYQPEFEVQTQSLQFTENVAPGVEWFTLTPTANLDDDPALANGDHHQRQPSNQQHWLTAPCYFIIDSDDTERNFQLDRYTHRLSNQRRLDRERKANYTLLVQATNSCNKAPAAPIYARPLAPQSQSGAELTTSNPAPVAIDYRSSDGGSGEFTETRSRSARSSSSAGSVNSSRAPETATELPPNTDEQVGAGFNTAAVDALLAADKSLLKVVVRVRDVNDNSPRFTQRVYTGGITTEADFGTVFMIVQAVDADADANSQIVYSLVKPIKRNLVSGTNPASLSAQNGKGNGLMRRRRSSTGVATTTNNVVAATITTTPAAVGLRPAIYSDESAINDIPVSDGDDLFVINAHTGEISLNFDPQKHMKGYFEFEVMANDTEGLFDSARVFIYLLRQDQRVKFVLRLTPQELRQRLNKFRSVFGNITGAIVNIDSYKYFENHDGSVDKKKTSLYLHFVDPNDNTIIDVDKVLTLIDNNIEYLDELYKEFHVLSSEAAHLPLSSSALIDPVDQIRTGLMGIASFLGLILVLVIALCLNQRTRYERQLKAATVTAFGGSPLHLEPDFRSQSNLPNTNLHSQDPNPIWMQGYADQDWLGGGGGAAGGGKSAGGGHIGAANHQNNNSNNNLEEADYLTSSENSDMNSLSGINSVTQLHYNATATATPRDSLNSSQGRVSGSGSGSTSTTNDRQALCRANAGRQTPQTQQQQQRAEVHQSFGQQQQQRPKEPELVGVLKSSSAKTSAGVLKKRSQLDTPSHQAPSTHSTFGAFKEVTIYTDHNQQALQSQFSQQQPQVVRQVQDSTNNLVRTINHNHNQQQQHHNSNTTTSQVNKIASQFNAKQQAPRPSNKQQQQQQPSNQPTRVGQQRILVHANGADVNQGIIKTQQQQHQQQQQPVRPKKVVNLGKVPANGAGTKLASPQRAAVGDIQHEPAGPPPQLAPDDFESSLSKLSILNLETTEL